MNNHETHEIELLTEEGSMASILSVTELDGGDDFLVLRLEFAGQVIEVSAPSCWDGLQRIREQLDSRSIRLVCFGASDVHASGMSAAMGIGDRAYKLTLGVPGRTHDIVRIFDTGPDVLPVSVAEQEAFYGRWLVSLKGG